MAATDVVAMRAGWDTLEQGWTTLIERARALPDEQRHESVDGEWSFVQTLRHLVFGIDKWCTAAILGEAFHPIGLPNTGSLDFPWPDLDRAADPSFDDAVAAREGRAARVREYLASIDDAALERTVDVLENVQHTVRDCVFTVLEESFEHQRYASRDLARLT